MSPVSKREAVSRLSAAMAEVANAEEHPIVRESLETYVSLIQGLCQQVVLGADEMSACTSHDVKAMRYWTRQPLQAAQRLEEVVRTGTHEHTLALRRLHAAIERVYTDLRIAE